MLILMSPVSRVSYGLVVAYWNRSCHKMTMFN